MKAAILSVRVLQKYRLRATNLRHVAFNVEYVRFTHVAASQNISAETLLPPVLPTRYQRFCAFIRTPESCLWPMGFLLLGAHIFFGVYIFSDDFLDDFENDDEAPTIVNKIVSLNKSSRQKFAEIRENFSAFKG